MAANGPHEPENTTPEETPDREDDNRRKPEELKPDPDESNPSGTPARKPKGEAGFELFDWADSLVTSLVFVVLLLSLVIKITEVVGWSMEPTLYNGERLIISNLFYEPKPGDVIVISKKTQDEPIVKRIIATEGQIVDVNIVERTVSVDGVVLQESYIKEETERLFDVVFPARVPEGCVFVLGDNRNESMDSRDSRIGFVDEREILGKVIIRVFPLDRLGGVR